jgi:hypothetical protein
MSTQERTDQTASRLSREARIDERLGKLLEPSTTSEDEWVRVHAGPCPIGPATRPRPFETRCATCDHPLEPGEGQRLVPRSHVVEHPPLVDQLEAAIAGSAAGAASAGGFESKPVANMEALSTLGTIERGTRFWIEVLTGVPAEDLHGRPAELLEQLRASLARFTDADLRDVDQDVLRWWAAARVVTTWDQAPIKVHAPCMTCDRFGGLRVRLDPMTAWCRHCGSAWDSTTIGILGEHIRIALDNRPLPMPSPRPWPPQSDEVGHGASEFHCACHGKAWFPARLAAECERRTAAAAGA